MAALSSELGKEIFNAAEKGDANRLRGLLSGTPDKKLIEYVPFNNITPLGISSDNGHDLCVRVLLAAGAKVNGTGKGMTPLHWASAKNHPSTVSILLAAGASINMTSGRDGWTPLMYAAFMGHSDVVKILLGAGADRKPKNEYGRTALDLAIQYRQDDVVAEFQVHAA